MADDESAEWGKSERAQQRLDKAVAALEQAVEERLVEGRKAADADVAKLRQENDRLRALNEMVSRRLDVAIKRLNGVLDNAGGA